MRIKCKYFVTISKQIFQAFVLSIYFSDEFLSFIPTYFVHTESVHFTTFKRNVICFLALELFAVLLLRIIVDYIPGED